MMVSENDTDSDLESGTESTGGGTDSDAQSGESAGSGGVEDMVDSEHAEADADSAGAGSDWPTEDDQAQAGATAGTGAETTEVEVTRESGSLLAAVVSFFIPGVGNMINGDTDRGIVILALFIAWTVLAWGVGFFLIGGIITVLTLGLGFIVQGLIALVILPIDLAIHVLAAVDAYKGSDIVDRVTVKVDELR